jgi:hypothetical protein
VTYIERDFKEAYIRMKERALDAERDRDALADALEDLLALPVAIKALEHLRIGIGTKTPNAAWLHAKDLIDRVGTPLKP